MLDLGFAPSSAILARRFVPPAVAALPSIELAGLGETGVTQGFTAHPAVTGYAATAGRFRRAPAGFVRCAADEERLCYDSAGRFTGQALEGPETYYSAAWDDPGAAHGTSDFAYLNGSQTLIDYAGEHGEPDIFGGTGGGVVITAAAQNQLHNTSALRATGVSTGDVIRYEAIVAITDATASGRIELRGSGNPSFAFTFAHNAAGEITAITTAHGAGAAFDAEYRDLGLINTKRWYHLIVWRKATGTADAAMGIGFGNIPADVGKKFHVCDLRLVHNPQVAPGSWPVCAPNKSFAADAVATSVSQTVGALFYGGAGRCRTRITDGRLALAADNYRAHDGYSLVSRIDLIASQEAADRTGLMPYPEMEREFAFWGGGDRTVLFGPARFAVDVDSANYAADYDNLTIANAFTAEPLLRGWIDGRLLFSASQLTGDLTLDDTLVFPTCSTLNDHFEQVDIRNLHLVQTSGRRVSAQRALFMSHPSAHSRARHQVQADDNLTTNQVYMGRLLITGTNPLGLSVDVSDSAFRNMGRALETGIAGANPQNIPMTVTADRVFYFQNWSDSFYLGYGDYSGSSFDNQFHGGFTSRSTTLFHSRKEIEVDIGSGWQPLSTTALTEDDLPVGRIARHVGDYDFTTQVLDTNTADPGREVIVRSWNLGSTPSGYFDRKGHQFHTSYVDEGTYKREPRQGETYVIEQIDPPGLDTPHIRLFVDWGRWSNATTFVDEGVRPALGSTGTHADIWQTVTTQIRLDGVSSVGMVTVGDAQGPFMQGSGSAGSALFGAIDFSHFVGLVSTNNAFVATFPSPALQTAITLSDSLIMPAWAPERDINGNSSMGALIRAAWAPVTLTLDNVWQGTRNGASPVGENGGIVAGTTENIRMTQLTDFDTWTPSTGQGPDGVAFIPPAFREAQSGYADPALIDNPLESGFAFAAFAESATGLPLNTILSAALATGATMKPLTDWLGPWQRDQDFIANVSNDSAIGTKIDLRRYERFRPESYLSAGGLAGTALEPRYGNPRPGLFDFDGDGDLAVVGDLSGIDKPFLLRTNADELILLDVN